MIYKLAFQRAHLLYIIINIKIQRITTINFIIRVARIRLSL